MSLSSTVVSTTTALAAGEGEEDPLATEAGGEDGVLGAEVGSGVASVPDGGGAIDDWPAQALTRIVVARIVAPRNRSIGPSDQG
jgi:hypothetical protein